MPARRPPQSGGHEPRTAVPRSSQLSVPQQGGDASKVTSPPCGGGPGTHGPRRALLPEPCCSPAKARFQGRRRRAGIGPHGRGDAAPPLPTPRPGSQTCPCTGQCGPAAGAGRLPVTFPVTLRRLPCFSRLSLNKNTRSVLRAPDGAGTVTWDCHLLRATGRGAQGRRRGVVGTATAWPWLRSGLELDTWRRQKQSRPWRVCSACRGLVRRGTPVPLGVPCRGRPARG